MKKRTSIILICFLLIINRLLFSQSLTGTTGLITIPTAEMHNDGQISCGLNFLNKHHPAIINDNLFGENSISPFITMNYLPFIEIGIRYTSGIENTKNKEDLIGDRSINLKLRLLKERKIFPAVVVGFHDFTSISYTNRHFNASYISVSKKIKINDRFFSFHCGYGTDSFNAYQHEFVGLFGGIDIQLIKQLSVLAEYDSKYFNCGTRIIMFDRIELIAALLQCRYFSGGISFRFDLLK